MAYLLILFTTVCTIGSQLILKHGLRDFAGLATDHKVEFLVRVATSPWVAGALVLQVVAYVAWFFVIAQEKLGVAIAVSGSFFYLIAALLSWLLFDERLSMMQWAGIGLVTLGVAFLAKG